jgi:tetratricopeptide (TPR) repeat protein
MAQGRSAELKERTKQLAVMLRIQPPEATLSMVDSLLKERGLASDPYWRQDLIHYRGHALRLLGRLDGAMEEQIRAYQLADSLQDRDGLANSLLALAAIYMDLNDVERAGRELRKVFAMNREQPIPLPYRVDLVMAAWCDFRELADSVLYWCNQGLPMAEAARDSFAMADFLFNRGIAYGATGHGVESERDFKRALEVLPALGYPHLEGRVSEILAFQYLEEGRLDEVPPLLDRAESMAVGYGGGELLGLVIGDRIEYHLARGDSASALAHVDRLLAVKDSLTGTMRARALAESQARFGVSRLEKELAVTKAEAEVNALRAQRSWLAWGAVGIIALLAGGSVRSFKQQARLKEQAARLLERDKERLLEENELLLQENLMARFETLKSQIDPHFLFNAMNTLYTLVETEPAKAREFIASFSALYRKVLSSRDRTIVPVQEELELVQHYLVLQRMRFGEGLLVTIAIPAQGLQRYLPPFTLQMLLENAIKHNVISAAKPLRIGITVEGELSGQAWLVVRNDRRPRGASAAGTGTGLENIRRRYAMLGGAEPAFGIEDSEYVAKVPLLAQET